MPSAPAAVMDCPTGPSTYPQSAPEPTPTNRRGQPVQMSVMMIKEATRLIPEHE